MQSGNSGGRRASESPCDEWSTWGEGGKGREARQGAVDESGREREWEWQEREESTNEGDKGEGGSQGVLRTRPRGGHWINLQIKGWDGGGLWREGQDEWGFVVTGLSPLAGLTETKRNVKKENKQPHRYSLEKYWHCHRREKHLSAKTLYYLTRSNKRFYMWCEIKENEKRKMKVMIREAAGWLTHKTFNISLLSPLRITISSTAFLFTAQVLSRGDGIENM